MTRQERREADKMAKMRKWSRLSGWLKRYKQNIHRTAHCSGSVSKFENVMRLQ